MGMTTSDRTAHLTTWTVTGPGLGARQSRELIREDHARQLAERLDLEHGAGTHRVIPPAGVAR